jgi:hypothetical protein
MSVSSSRRGRHRIQTGMSNSQRRQLGCGGTRGKTDGAKCLRQGEMRSYRVLLGTRTLVIPPHTLSLTRSRRFVSMTIHPSIHPSIHPQWPTAVGMWISLRKPGCLGPGLGVDGMEEPGKQSHIRMIRGLDPPDDTMAILITITLKGHPPSNKAAARQPRHSAKHANTRRL